VESVRIHIASVEFIPRNFDAGIQPPEAIRRLKPPLEIRSSATAESARIHIASVEFIPRHLDAGIHALSCIISSFNFGSSRITIAHMISSEIWSYSWAILFLVPIILLALMILMSACL
jgi:hypothetical protein